MDSGSVIIVGGGIIGLAIASKLSATGKSVTLLEKESSVGSHQTSRNSGVIHAGPYYTPGSLKAGLCSRGNKLMVQLAQNHNIPFEITGKLILATSEVEMAVLLELAHRAETNGVPSEIISRERIGEIEPFAAGISALHVKTTGIIDFGEVARKLAEISAENGAELITNASALSITESSNKIFVEHTKGTHSADMLVNAAGLYSDRIAVMAGFRPNVRIVPFRGEYFKLRPNLSHMVRGLIYPVPNPRFPFLGVHLTRMIGGDVHAGPNAVLALAREGYSWGGVNLGDVWSTLNYPGFARLAARNFSTGVQEVARSLSKSLFARDLSKLVPGIAPSDLAKSNAGVRAQAINRDGRLVDDFSFQRSKNQIHILNAPSPAATASLAIAEHVISLLGQD